MTRQKETPQKNWGVVKARSNSNKTTESIYGYKQRRECALRLPPLANGIHDPEVENIERSKYPNKKQRYVYSWGYESEQQLLKAIYRHAYNWEWWRRDILKRFRRDELALYESACKTKGYMPYPHDKEVNL